MCEKAVDTLIEGGKTKGDGMDPPALRHATLANSRKRIKKEHRPGVQLQGGSSRDKGTELIH